MTSVEKKLAEKGINLPKAPKLAFNYIPYVITGNLLFVSGQIPLINGDIIKGKLGATIEIEQGVEAARVCAINLLAHVKDACSDDLERLTKVVKLTGFVNSTPEFDNHPMVINGASDLFVDVLGESGRHARSAVGMANLPLGAAVEVEGIFEFKS
ncbi:MAG: RidA family protein [Rhodobacteraceae bacterium]|nr:RidA family protein [Paracoccaceae bacterium]